MGLEQNVRFKAKINVCVVYIGTISDSWYFCSGCPVINQSDKQLVLAKVIIHFN